MSDDSILAPSYTSPRFLFVLVPKISLNTVINMFLLFLTLNLKFCLLSAFCTRFDIKKEINKIFSHYLCCCVYVLYFLSV